MKLYEIDSALEALVDPETGELLDYEQFARLQMEREAKIENTALYVKNLEAEAKAIKEEEARLSDRRKAMENKAKRLREYIGFALDGEKFETVRCSISYRKSTALEVDDITAAAEWLDDNGHPDMVVYSAPTIDKRAVKDLIKGGTQVPGVELVERQSLQLR